MCLGGTGMQREGGVSARAPPKKMPAATAPKMMNAVCINGMIKSGSYMTRHWERRKSQ